MGIKLKIGVPTIILTLIIITLIIAGVISLTSAQHNSQDLAAWFEENGAILDLSHKVSNLMHPHLRLTMGQDFENNNNTIKQIGEQRRLLRDAFNKIRKDERLTAEEKERLAYLDTRLRALEIISDQIIALKLPYQHDKGMQLIHELSVNHIKPTNRDLFDWYLKDQDQINEKQLQAKTKTQNYLILSGLLAGLTLLALLLAVWVNNVGIIEPILVIKENTEKLAKGKLDTRIELSTKDEIGALASDINNMAESLEKTNQRLTQAARTDGLTGIWNRRCCDETLEQHLSAARRYNLFFSVLMLDVDHFKEINDQHGHAIGDQAIKDIARICVDQLRDCDFVFRYGGEEFLLLLPNTDKNDSLVVAERVRKTIRTNTIEVDNVKIKLTASLGIASFPEDGLTVGDLIRNADNALYQAKQRGRNQTVAFEKPLLI